MSVTWDPDQYGRFGRHRLRPALELLARVQHPDPRTIYDLGCGTGEMARSMADRWPDATVVGVDASAEMLERAAALAGRVRWERADVRDWRPERPPDVIFSNAALHWIESHGEVLVRLVASLAPGGVLAVQMPLSWGEPSHRLMRDVLVRGGRGGAPLGDESLRRRCARRPVAGAAEYYDLLGPAVAEFDIWETRYVHVLDGDDPVLEWVKGTGLRPVLTDLQPDDRDRFLAVYAAVLRAAYPKRRNGRTLYPFPRLFFVARVTE